MVHRLLQTITSKDNLKSYQSLHSYRNAASQRSTFQSTIQKVKKRINCLLDDIESGRNVTSQSRVLNSITNLPPRRTNPSRACIANLNNTCSAIPENVNNGLVGVTGSTPLKTKRAIDKGEGCAEVLQRWKYCSGKPFLIEQYGTGNQARRRQRFPCCICGSKTSWRCLECKEWFCMENGEDSKNRKRKFTLIQTVIPGKGAANFQSSCFHAKHREAWEQQHTSGQNQT